MSKVIYKTTRSISSFVQRFQDLQSKSVDWFHYDRDFRYERVKDITPALITSVLRP